MSFQIYESGNYLIIDTYDNVKEEVIASAQYAKKNSYYNKTANGYVISEFGGGEFPILATDIAANLWTDNALVPLSENAIVDILQNHTGNFKSAAGGSAAVGAKPLKTNQTTSYQTGDDGDTQRGRLTDFFTLANNNVFGNNKVFTGTTGGYDSGGSYYDKDGNSTTSALAFPNNVVLVHTSDDSVSSEIMGVTYGYYGTWSSVLTYITGTLATDGYTDWTMMNRSELEMLINEAATRNLSYEPFLTIVPGGILASDNFWWTGTTPVTNTARAKAFYNVNLIDGNEMRTIAKYGAARSYACRYYTYTELGL